MPVKPVPEVFALGVDHVNDQIRIGLLCRRENGHFVVGRQVLQTEAQVRALGHEKAALAWRSSWELDFEGELGVVPL
jgi:2-keto-4-pentenoate hydratase/2-oxohepta-3-ene-1,7-dioic acid hydratase in catechol pathway